MPDEPVSTQESSILAPRLTAAGCIAAFSVAALLPGLGTVPVLIALAVLLAISVFLGHIQQVHLALICLFFAAKKLVFPGLPAWPYDILLPLAAYTGTVLAFPGLRRSVGWLARGRLSPGVLLTCAAIVAVSAGGLLGWYFLFRPDLGLHASHLPALPVWALPATGLGFALFNAAMEEAVFRGIVMASLEDAFGPGWVALILQAAAFGFAHFLKGFPNGWLGVGMTFLYGLMLGYLKRRSQGMLAVWVVHVFADMVVFGVVVWVVFGG